MAKKSVVEVRLDIKNFLPKILESDAIVNEIGKTIVETSIDAMSKGLSLVKGQGRFVGYKKPDKYPGKKKNKRPVNLKLTGDLYKSLSFERKKNEISYGLLKGKTVGDADIYGPVHNADDPRRPDIPTRRFIPSRQGEEFIVTIMVKLRDIIAKRLADLIRASNK